MTIVSDLMRVNLAVIHKAIPEGQAIELFVCGYYLDQFQAKTLATMRFHASIDFPNGVSVVATISVGKPCVSCTRCDGCF